MYRIFVKWTSLVFVLLVLFSLTACGKIEISDAEHVQRAKQYQTEGDFQATLIELKSALQENPKNSEARLLLGELYIALGNGTAAEKELARASDLGVSGPYFQRLRGKSLLLQGRYDDALKAIEHLDVDNEIDLLVLQANTYIGLGDAKKAHASFSRVLELQPTNDEALLGLAKLSFQKGEFEAAGNTVARVLSAEPDSVEALILQGRILLRKDKSEAALASFQKAVNLLGNTTLVTRQGMIARTDLARLLIAQGDFEEAKIYVDYLLKAAPKHPKPNYMAGLLAYEQKDMQKAKGYLLKVIKVLPNHLPSLFLLGSANFALGNVEQAEQQLARVVAAKPSLLSARMLLASIRLQQAQSDQALDALELGLAQQPDNVRLLAMAGQAALQGGEFEKSRGFLKKAIAEQPSVGSLRTQMAMLYLAEGNEALAIQELEQAIELGEAPVREKSLLALTYLRQKDFDKALSTAKELAADHPKSVYSQNLMGVILGARGEIAQARAAFTVALKLEPEFTPASLNLARLDVLSGRLNEARERLDGILVRDEKNTSAMMALAQLADAENDQVQALVWLEKIRAADTKELIARLVLIRYYSRTGELDRARVIARETEAIEGQNPRVLMAIGRVELISQDYRAAVGTFEKAVKEAPDAQSYYSLGVAQFRANDDSAARASLAQALKLQPAYLQAASLLVMLDVKAGHIKDALRGVGEIKRQHPKLSAGFMLEGDIRARQKQSARAARAYARARALGGGTQALLKEAAVLQGSQGNEAAIKLLASWVKTHQDDVTARYALAVAYSSERRGTADAIKEYRRLLQGAPEYVPALNDLAWLLYQGGKLGEAAKFAAKAYDLRSDNGPVLDTLGWIRLKQGDTKVALGLLRQASEKMPDAGDVQYHLAAALAQSGKKAESREILERILGTGQGFSSRQKAQQLLDSLK